MPFVLAIIRVGEKWFGPLQRSQTMSQPRSLPSALDPQQGVLPRLRGQQLAVFLDYDGTLTPIVARPELAVMPAAMRETVRSLATYCPVAIVSGRDRADVQHLVRLEMLCYAGSHGFDIAGPQGMPIQHRVGERFVIILDQTEAALHRQLDRIKGILIERKAFSIAVHVRHVPPHLECEVESQIDAILSRAPQLRKGHGKKVFELQPAIDWNKGQAVLWLLRALGPENAWVTPLYIGDDVTDEDAFQALTGVERGLGILVAESPRPTAAQFTLRHPHDVQHFLQQLTLQVASGM